jgi:hypothetical protein
MKIQYSCLAGGGEILGVRHESFPKLVRFGDVHVPESFTAELQAPDLPGVITVRVRVDAKRGPLVQEFTLAARKGRSISPQDLHQLPLAYIRDEIMARAPTYTPKFNEQGEIFGIGGKPAGAASAEIRAELHRHGYRRIDDPHLRAVAEAYRAADRHPTKAVAERFGAPRPTAARWVMTARERGFLEPVEHRPADTLQQEGGRG